LFTREDCMGRRKSNKRKVASVKRSTGAYFLTKLILKTLLFPFFRLEVSGLRNLPRDSAFILLPKHQRWEDIPFTALAVPRQLYFVAKHELFKTRFTDRLFKALGGIPLNRKKPIESRRYLLSAIRMLERGEGMVVYPEGTYFRKKMGPGHTGMLRFILSRLSMPLIPVGIRYSLNGWRVHVRVAIGRVTYQRSFEPADRLLARLMGEMADLSGYPIHPDTEMTANLFDPAAVTRALFDSSRGVLESVQGGIDRKKASVVLFLVGSCPVEKGARSEPCLILNKRSARVRQPGDLCCPGGGVSPGFDRLASGLLKLPGSPLVRWPYWRRLKRVDGNGHLAVLMATAFREGLEEMRLNPLGLEFLGMLPRQDLVLFSRMIYPLVCRVKRQQRFFPNWEVERIVPIPIRHLLDPGRYAQYRLTIDIHRPDRPEPETRQLPCFIHRQREGSDIFWGATLRIALQFLEIVYGFIPPELDTLPVVQGRLTGEYLTGINPAIK
jgi:1-acyl-sn-glycerol-3-phosphate acyltransferase